jgi:hypothetical protein
MSRDAWHTYCDDARWLVEHHGPAVTGAGWSLADLFEIIPGRPDTGGLIEMLRGSRDLAVDGRVATFTRRKTTWSFEARGGSAEHTGWTGRAPWQP